MDGSRREFRSREHPAVARVKTLQARNERRLFAIEQFTDSLRPHRSAQERLFIERGLGA
jgi:hypothetical protein